MWTAHRETLTETRTLRFTLDADAQPASLETVLRAWQTDTSCDQRQFDATIRVRRA
jgi:hypothetical protein